MNGFNNFDMVCFINLDHRRDRLEHITNELNKTNIDKNKINRISGLYVKDFGALGCSKSHILALESFINSSESNQNCLILEDDFEFTQSQDIINDLINKVFNSDINNFDVLMLASNTVYHYNIDNIPVVTKIIDAQTLSGYVVSRKFAPILLQNFKKGLELLEPFGKPVGPFCVDMFCKKLQPIYNWYCICPKIGKQSESYSDIENRRVNYGV
jgi:GR25 family glycosyltransferase involved in LPS biosynthesis